MVREMGPLDFALLVMFIANFALAGINLFTGNLGAGMFAALGALVVWIALWGRVK